MGKDGNNASTSIDAFDRRVDDARSAEGVETPETAERGGARDLAEMAEVQLLQHTLQQQTLWILLNLIFQITIR